MKNFKFLMAFVLVAVMLAVSAFATVSINFDVEETTTDSGADCYKVVVTQTDDEGDWRALQTKIAFNYDKIIPIDWYEGVVPSYVGEEAEYPFVFGSFKSGRTSTAELTRPGAPEWTINGADSEVVVELSWGYLDTFPITANNSFIYEMYFKLADGVELADIYEDDFNVYYVKYVNGPVFNYVGNADASLNNMVLTNNVVNEAPVVSEDWVAGAGYLIDGAASATTKTETSATKVSVSHGGYYIDADNWGGVASKEKVTVDDLEIEVVYSSIPETDNDRWMYIGVLDNPSIFVASKTATYNKGYVNLIRYGEDSRMVAYGVDAWSDKGSYGTGTGFFAIEEGDVLRVCFDKNDEDTYDVTYIKNNAEFLEGPKGLALSDTAHVVVSASCKNSPKDAFAYTVDTAPAALEVAKLPVKAGDVVYKAGAEIAPVVIAEDGTYNIVITEANCGTYIVNTGYTAQVGYVVAKTGVTEFALENGVLGSNKVAMREVDPQGIRFFGTVTQDVREYAGLVEYGFIMTAESEYNALGNNYVLDMDLVSKNKAKKGVAYNGADLDKCHELDAEKIVIAGVLHGIPEDVAGVKTVIASRPYYKLSDETYVYGEVTKASLYQIAKTIYGDDNYAASQEYAKKIIEIVDGSLEEPEEPEEPENESIIDVGSLYR